MIFENSGVQDGTLRVKLNMIVKCLLTVSLETSAPVLARRILAVKMPPRFTLWDNGLEKTTALLTVWRSPPIKRIRHPQDAKNVFWLNYRVSCTLLTVLVILSSIYSLYDSTDSAIQCYHDKGLKLPKKYLNRYCWMMSTFTLPKYFDNQSEEKSIHPGVGPFTEKDEKIYHAYYQWVPLFLFFQCACFYGPRALWKYFEGGKFKNLIIALGLNKKKKNKDDEDDEDDDCSDDEGGKPTGASSRCHCKCLEDEHNANDMATVGSSRYNCTCNDGNVKKECENLPFGLLVPSKNGRLARLVKAIVEGMTNQEFEPMVENLRHLPPKNRVHRMRDYLRNSKPVNLGQVVKCFKGKLMTPEIVQYLVERVSCIDTKGLLEWIEKQPQEIHPLDVFEHLLTCNDGKLSGTELTSVLSNRSYEYRCQDMRLYICEFFSFGNGIFQLGMMILFLGPKFVTYGFQVFAFLFEELEERTDILSVVFPKMSKCTFHKYGPSGTIEQLDGLCILGVNIINEKIFILLWFWFILLAICSLGSFIFQTHAMFKPNYRPRFLKWINKKGLTEVETTEYRYLMEQLSYHLDFYDWLILYLYTQNVHISTEWKTISYLLILVKVLFPKEEGIYALESSNFPKTSMEKQKIFPCQNDSSKPMKAE